MKESSFEGFYMKVLFVLFFFLLSAGTYGFPEDIPGGNKFIFAQLVYQGNWDLRSQAWGEIYPLLSATTSIKTIPQRHTTTLSDPKLFSLPALWWLGDNSFAFFSNQEIEYLKRWLLNGGLLIIDDLSGKTDSLFFKAVRDQLSQTVPEAKWEKIPSDYAIYRSFYLLSEASGRRMVSKNLEGFFLEDQLLAIYSANDLLGVWGRTPLGEYIYNCVPGGESQRLQAQKLTLNLIVFALTGTYKSDVIHQPFLEIKMGR